jgi:hypothetical protein
MESDEEEGMSSGSPTDATEDVSGGAEGGANLSALKASIKKKGNTSYYYAHGSDISGPVWDGREEPRLLMRTESLDSSSKKAVKQFESYAWADEKKNVKVYVDFPEADSVDEQFYKLVHNILYWFPPILPFPLTSSPMFY